MNRLTKKFYMTMVNNIAKSHGLKVQSKSNDRKAVWEAELARLNKNPKVNFNRKLRAFEKISSARRIIHTDAIIWRFQNEVLN